jgi:hypothetical protein
MSYMTELIQRAGIYKYRPAGKDAKFIRIPLFPAPGRD